MCSRRPAEAEGRVKAVAVKAFITGASGFIGNHLVEELLDKNWQVSVLLHKRSIPKEKECKVIMGNIGYYSYLREAFKGTDVLFHLAAALGSSLINKEEFFRINAEGTENILRAAREAGVKRIVHFSSSGVLGSVKKHETADENYPKKPIDVYDKSKLEGEKIALRYAREGMDVVVVRPGWVYGPGDRRTFKLIKSIAKKRFILITKGKAWQTPVYIKDLIKATLLCAEKGQKGQIYHLAGREVLTVKQIVETIAEAEGMRLPRFSLPLFPVKIAACSMGKAFSLFKREAPLTMGKLAFFIHPKPISIRKAEKELGYSPETNFKEGMAQTIAWYREHNWI